MSQEKNKVIVLEPVAKPVEELLKALGKQAEIMRVAASDEAIQLVRQYQPCMLIAGIHDNNHIPDRVNMLKKLESSIKYGLVKTLFVSSLKNKQLGTLISSLGVTDFMEEPVSARTLQFKANLQLKAVETIRKQQEQKKASQEKIVFKKADQKAAEGAAVGGDSAAKPAPALELDQDTFLFKNSGVKKNGKKMIVELEGPDPETGDWVPHEDKGNPLTSWRWMPNEEKGTPAAEAGDGWLHAGDKPQFQDASGKWQFASEKPELAYQKNGQKVAKKVSTAANGEVSVAADSPAAEAKVKKYKEEKQKRKKQKEEAKLAAAAAAEATTEATAETKASAAEKAEKKKSAAKGPGGAPEAETTPAGPAATGAEAKREESPTPAPSAAGEVVELKDRRGPAEPTEEKEKKKKGPASALDFLQKKKEQLAKSAPPSEAEAPAPATAGTKKEEPAAEAEKAETAAAAAEPEKKKKKSAANAAQDALDRMKQKLGANELPGEAVAEAPAAQAEAPPEPEEEASFRQLKKKKEKATKEVGDLKFSEAKPEAEAPAPDDLKFSPEKERKKKKQAVLEDIRAELAKPLPDFIPEAEAEAMRKELGLENQPDLPAKDLARKHRAAKVKKLKDGLLDLENSLAEAPPVNQHDLTPDETANTWSESNGAPPEERRKMRAFDSDLPEAEDTEGKKGEKKKKEKKARAEKADQYHYLPQATVTPVGGAWDRAGEHYAFLAGEIRYRGFEKLEDLLPLWIHRGEQVPELLDKDKQWRFLGSPPTEVKNAAEIPRDVRDFLLALRDQLRTDAEEGGEEKPAKKEPKRDFNALLATMEKEEAALRAVEDQLPGEKPETQADTLEEIFDKKEGAEERPDSVAAQLEKDASPSMQAFLERRKRKQEKPAAQAEKARGELTNPYLGIYVALSNAFGPPKDRVKAAIRALKTMESSFGSCLVAVVGEAGADGQCVVKFSGGNDPAPESRVELVSGLHLPIQRRGGDSKEILGYLWIKPTGTRNGLSEGEQKAANKVALTLWPILSGAPAPEEKKAA